MKKYITILFAILAFSACQMQLEQESPVAEETNVLTATIQSGTDTKTSLSPMEDGLSSVLWSEGDAIGVSIDGLDDFNLYALTYGAGTKKGSFSGSGRGSSYVAYYPVSGAKSHIGEEVGIELPAEQEYTEGNIAPGALPMVAASSTSELSFKAVASILKLSLKGHQMVTRIVFRSNDSGIKVSGPAKISLSDLSAPMMEMSADAADSLVLNVGLLFLDENVAKDFYLVLPPQTYKGGFTVRIYTTNGYMDKSLDSDFTMERGKVHPADVLTVKLTSGVDSSPSLSGRGTSDDPFLISSVGDLKLMQERVNVGDGLIRNPDGLEVDASRASYLLTKDLDLSRICGSKVGSWTPIGHYEYSGENRRFMGSFDGGGHKIKNLYIGGDSDQQGLFGAIMDASIRNLTVHGDVSCSSFSGIMCGMAENTVFENCTVGGKLASVGFHCGGIVGVISFSDMTYCRNEAEIKGYYNAGGICGDADPRAYIVDCVNVGAVSGARYVGGVAGYDDGGRVIDCINLGSVEGGTRVGGLSGFIQQGGKIFNSINYGNVTGEDFVGGICGFVSSLATAYFGEGTVANCINLGGVSVSGGSNVGWLASYVGLEDGVEPYEGEPLDAAWVKNSYWLKGADDSIKGVGGGPGIVEDVYALTDAQMKGAAYDGVLYKAPGSSDGFNRLIDALNAGAVQWSKDKIISSGNVRTHLPLSGWMFGSSSPYPSHTDLDARMPGDGKPVLLVSDKAFEFAVKGGQFTLEVTSDEDYSFENLPSWIRKGSVKTPDNRPHYHVHTFTVTANNTGSVRKATFEVRSASGVVQKVKVSQKAPYMTVSATEFAVYDYGGSKTITIASSLDWEATTSTPWLEVTPWRGSGDGNVTVRMLANEGSSAREGSLEIASADGSVKYTVSVIQSGSKGEEEVGDWENLPFYHQSVAFRFTATWCYWCPYMHSSIKRAQELYPGKIQHLALHSGGSDLQFDPAGTLMSSFGADGFPTGIVDGRIDIPNSSDIEDVAPKFVAAAKETEEVYGTASGMAIRSTAGGQVVRIGIDAYFKLAGRYKITVLLVEDGIVHEQTNGGYDYVHDDVVRATATNILGDPVTVSRDLTKKSFNYVVSVPAECNIANMSVFAYIQREFGSAVRIQSGNYGDYYVDNCATVQVGESLKLALVGDGSGGSGGSGGGNEEIGTGNEIR